MRDLILVVEDEPMQQADAAYLLDQAGLEVVAMASADEAIAFVKENGDEVAAIFTDIQMPGHADGLHLAEVVGTEHPEIVVVMTSGRVAPMGPLPANVRFLPKPWRPEEVLATIRRTVP